MDKLFDFIALIFILVIVGGFLYGIVVLALRLLAAMPL